MAKVTGTAHSTDIEGIPMYEAKGLSLELGISLPTARNLINKLGGKRIGRKKYISRRELRSYLGNKL